MRVRSIIVLCSAGVFWAMGSMVAQAQFGFGIGFPGSQQQGGKQTRPSPNDVPSSDGGGRNGSSWFPSFDLLINPSSPRKPKELSPREAFEQRFAQESPEEAVREFEALQISEFGQYLGLPTNTIPPTAAQISTRLSQIAQETGKRPAVIYAVALKKQTHLLLVTPANTQLGYRAHPMLVASAHLRGTQIAQMDSPPVIRKVLGDVSRETVVDMAKAFRKAVSNPNELDASRYRDAATQLYRWMVAPLEPQLASQKIDTLLFSMDDGLRTIPVAALSDGNRFLVEQYSSALIPSFGLTDSGRALALNQQPLLAMGITKSTNGMSPLPAVSTEISAISGQLWSGPSRHTLDEASTLDNLKDLYSQQRFGVLHLATHAVFNSGQADNSFIQFWQSRLTLSQVRHLSKDLQWNNLPSLQLLVLSACQTALGNKDAELGFAGTALNAGVPAAIASLWSVNDTGSLGLMTGFYDALKTLPTKAEALRQAQLQMLQGQTRLQNGQLTFPNHPPIPLPATAELSASSLTHPYFWSGYTVVGNWN